MNAGEEREYERQEKLREVQNAVHKFEDELIDDLNFSNMNRRDRYMQLLSVFLGKIREDFVPLDDVFFDFVDNALLPGLKQFSKTPEELRFMQAKTMEIFVGTILNESAWELHGQEQFSPEKIYGKGKTRTSPVH